MSSQLTKFDQIVKFLEAFKVSASTELFPYANMLFSIFQLASITSCIARTIFAHVTDPKCSKVQKLKMYALLKSPITQIVFWAKF